MFLFLYWVLEWCVLEMFVCVSAQINDIFVVINEINLVFEMKRFIELSVMNWHFLSVFQISMSIFVWPLQSIFNKKPTQFTKHHLQNSTSKAAQWKIPNVFSHHFDLFYSSTSFWIFAYYQFFIHINDSISRCVFYHFISYERG